MLNKLLDLTQGVFFILGLVFTTGADSNPGLACTLSLGCLIIVFILAMIGGEDEYI